MLVATQIASSLDLSEREVYIASLIGLFHDYGRFEQLRIFDTFKDIDSVDHADLGVELLFDKNHIDMFVDDLTTEEKDIMYFAIKNHNKLAIEPNLTPIQNIFCKIARDADKIDIYRVMTTNFVPSKQKVLSIEDSTIKSFYNHKLLEYKNESDFYYSVILKLCWVFDLNFKKSFQILMEQGYLQEYKYYVLLWTDFKIDERVVDCFDYVLKYVKEHAKNS